MSKFGGWSINQISWSFATPHHLPVRTFLKTKNPSIHPSAIEICNIYWSRQSQGEKDLHYKLTIAGEKEWKEKIIVPVFKLALKPKQTHTFHACFIIRIKSELIEVNTYMWLDLNPRPEFPNRRRSQARRVSWDGRTRDINTNDDRPSLLTLLSAVHCISLYVWPTIFRTELSPE